MKIKSFFIIMLFLTIITDCSKTNSIDKQIQDLFDMFYLADNASFSSISDTQQKRLSSLIKNGSEKLTKINAKEFIALYPDAKDSCNYYPLSAFSDSKGKLYILLFYELSNNSESFIIQTINNDKYIADFNLTRNFPGLKNKMFSSGGVVISDCFCPDFSIQVFSKPKDSDDTFGELFINKEGNIRFQTGTGIP